MCGEEGVTAGLRCQLDKILTAKNEVTMGVKCVIHMNSYTHILMGDHKKRSLFSRLSCQKYHGPQLCGRAGYSMKYTTFRSLYPLILSQPKR